MNPFTAMLQACHSALIDELCDRYPEPKPELGLPVRLGQWKSPDAAIERAYAALFEFGSEVGSEGIIALCTDDSLLPALGLTLEALTQAWIRRCGTEFHRRSIAPALRPFEWTPFVASQATVGIQEVTRIVWMPIRLKGGALHLGIGARSRPAS